MVAAVLTIMNERGQPVRQWLCRSKSLHDMTKQLIDHFESYAKLGLEPPKLMYVDNVEEVEQLLLECYTSLRPENGGFGVKQCPTHALRRLIRSLNQSHPLVQRFIADIAYAMYELDAGDVKAVKDVLRKAGKTEAQIDALGKRYFHRHKSVRRYLKPKGQLERDVDRVFKEWKVADTFSEVHGSLFLEGEGGTEHEYAKLRALMKGGWLSDPPRTDFPVYHKVGTTASGLPIYRCVRGTSQLEGYHSHLHKATRDAPNHGPLLAECKLLDLNFSFSYNGYVKNTEGAVQHFTTEPWELDFINRAYEKNNLPAPYESVLINRLGTDEGGLMSAMVPPQIESSFKEFLLEQAQCVEGLQAQQIETNVLESVGEVSREWDGGDPNTVEESTGDTVGPSDVEMLMEATTTLATLARNPVPASTTTAVTTRNPETTSAAAASHAHISSPTPSGNVQCGQDLRVSPVFAPNPGFISARHATQQASKSAKRKWASGDAYLNSFSSLPDIPRHVTTPDEKILFSELFPAHTNQRNETDWKEFVDHWNKSYVFPSLVDGKVPGPYYIKDVGTLRAHADEVVKQQAIEAATNSMMHGSDGYLQTLSSSHSVRHFTPAAPVFNPSFPLAEQPSQAPHTIHLMHPTTIAHGIDKVPLTFNPKADLQRGKQKRCANCRSFKGGLYRHPSNVKGWICPFVTKRFEDDPTGVLKIPP